MCVLWSNMLLIGTQHSQVAASTMVLPVNVESFPARSDLTMIRCQGIEGENRQMQLLVVMLELRSQSLCATACLCRQPPRHTQPITVCEHAASLRHRVSEFDIGSNKLQVLQHPLELFVIHAAAHKWALTLNGITEPAGMSAHALPHSLLHTRPDAAS
jgi:hypothetical protein